jgi:hypothetical protein
MEILDIFFVGSCSYTFCSRVQTAIRIYRFAFVSLAWGTSCIPLFLPSTKFHLFKPNTMVRVLSVVLALTYSLPLREAKSLFIAVCMGYITADASMVYFCHSKDAKCNKNLLHTRGLCLAILYQFFCEATCDIRGIAEDKRDAVP